MTTATVPFGDVVARALPSLGASSTAIYRAVATVLRDRHSGGGTLLDVGCGRGHLWPFVLDRFERYIGADAVRYEDAANLDEFFSVNFDAERLPVPDALADVVAAVETIEHLENPRAFVRELARLVRPGGWLVVTTPNQLSLLSKMTLLWKNQFNAFQGSNYPAHLTALLEIDLRRMAAECGLVDVAVAFTGSGRVAGTPWHYPRWLSRCFPRALSDNVLLMARKPLDR